MATLQNKLNPVPAVGAAPVVPVQPDITKSRDMTITTEDLDDNNKLANKLRSSADYLKQSQQLLEDPQFKAGTPPETKQELQAAINKAQELYQTQSNRNDWLEVAQNLSGALTQFGAAQHAIGSNARFYQAPDLGRGIDYGARSDRALREMGQNVDSAKTLANAGEQDYAKNDAIRSGKLKNELNLRDDARSAALRKEEDALREKLALNREGRQNRREREKDDIQERKMVVSQNNDSLRELLSKEKYGGQLANALQQEDDLSSKNADKLKQKYSDLAGKAGVSLENVMSAYDREAPRINPDEQTGLAYLKSKAQDMLPEGFGGGREIDKPKAYKTLEDAIGLTDMRDKIEKLKLQNRALARVGPVQPGKPAVQSETAPPPAPQQDSQIADYAKKNNLDYEAAKKVLIGRGYKPAH